MGNIDSLSRAVDDATEWVNDLPAPVAVGVVIGAVLALVLAVILVDKVAGGSDPEHRAAVEDAARAWVGAGGELRGCGRIEALTRCDVVTASGREAQLLCSWAERACERALMDYPPCEALP